MRIVRNITGLICRWRGGFSTIPRLLIESRFVLSVAEPVTLELGNVELLAAFAGRGGGKKKGSSRSVPAGNPTRWSLSETVE